MQKRIHSKNWNTTPKKWELPGIFQSFNLRQSYKAVNGVQVKAVKEAMRNAGN